MCGEGNTEAQGRVLKPEQDLESVHRKWLKDPMWGVVPHEGEEGICPDTVLYSGRPSKDRNTALLL